MRLIIKIDCDFSVSDIQEKISLLDCEKQLGIQLG